jgi:hypothetical protein
MCLFMEFPIVLIISALRRSVLLTIEYSVCLRVPELPAGR